MQNVHLMNAAKRDATIAFAPLKYVPSVKLGMPGKTVAFQKFLLSTESGLDGSLAKEHGEDYAKAMIEGDPEIDMEMIGRRIGATDVVYLSSEGEVLNAAPTTVEVVFAPDGTERDRHEPEDVPGNVNEELPVRWTGRKLPKAEAVRKFLFRRTVQLRHVDGLTYDFLYNMAKELHEENVMVLLGAGANGKEPLIFQSNGSPYRGFLEGRIDGEKYQLLLRLSSLELKRPAGV